MGALPLPQTSCEDDLLSLAPWESWRQGKSPLKVIPPRETLSPLVISGSIFFYFWVKKGVSDNANEEVLEVLVTPILSSAPPCLPLCPH